MATAKAAGPPNAEMMRSAVVITQFVATHYACSQRLLQLAMRVRIGETGPMRNQFRRATPSELNAVRLPAGERLRNLRTRAGITVAGMAEALDMAPSTYSSIENRSAKRVFDVPFAAKLMPILVGRGIPPISPVEVTALAGLEDANKPLPPEYSIAENVEVRMNGTFDLPKATFDQPAPVPSVAQLPRDVPVYGTAQGTSDGSGAFHLNATEGPIDWVRRPPGIMTNRRVFGIYIENDSMAPRFEPGELVYLDPARPPQVGGYVVVEMWREEEPHSAEAIIKRLLRRTSDRLILEQFNPPATLEISAERVKAVHRVLTLAELLGI